MKESKKLKFLPDQLKLFWYWVNERHAIYLKRKEGKPWPWTKDPILREFKFTNVFRQLDKQTVFLTNSLAYAAMQGARAQDLVGVICMFRMFNLNTTLERLLGSHGRKGYGFIRSRHWNSDIAKEELRSAASAGEKVFTGAYIITNNGSTRPKIDLVCDAVAALMENCAILVDRMERDTTLRATWKFMLQFPMVGPFVAYELVTDFRHIPGLLAAASDIHTWANPGPGAQRGINRLLTRDAHQPALSRGNDAEEYVEAMRQLLSMANMRTRSYVPAMEMRDIEHSLCEFDKYMRAATGEGRPRSRYTPPTT